MGMRRRTFGDLFYGELIHSLARIYAPGTSRLSSALLSLSPDGALIDHVSRYAGKSHRVPQEEHFTTSRYVSLEWPI